LFLYRVAGSRQRRERYTFEPEDGCKGECASGVAAEAIERFFDVYAVGLRQLFDLGSIDRGRWWPADLLPIGGVPDRPPIGIGRVELFPADGGGHRRSRTGAQRPGRYHRLSPPVAQPVDEHPASPLLLEELGRGGLGMTGGDDSGELAGPSADPVEVVARLDLGSHVVAAGPRRHQARVQTRRLHQLASGSGGVAGRAVLVGWVEVEDDAIGTVQVRLAGGPDMEGDRVLVDQVEEVLGRVDEWVVGRPALLGNFDPLDRVGEVAACSLLHEAFRLDPARGPLQGEGASF